VREGYTNDPASYSWISEGFCQTLKLTSEMVDGSVQIDGYLQRDLGIGESFTLSILPEYSLRCIRLQ